MLARAVRGNFDREGRLWRVLSPGAQDLVRRLLEVNPEKRLTAAKALQVCVDSLVASVHLSPSILECFNPVCWLCVS